jgi:hypothetical protein
MLPDMREGADKAAIRRERAAKVVAYVREYLPDYLVTYNAGDTSCGDGLVISIRGERYTGILQPDLACH